MKKLFVILILLLSSCGGGGSPTAPNPEPHQIPTDLSTLVGTWHLSAVASGQIWHTEHVPYQGIFQPYFTDVTELLEMDWIIEADRVGVLDFIPQWGGAYIDYNHTVYNFPWTIPPQHGLFLKHGPCIGLGQHGLRGSGETISVYINFDTGAIVGTISKNFINEDGEREQGVLDLTGATFTRSAP